MKHIKFLILLLLTISCTDTETHFLNDPAYRKQVKHDFKAKKKILPHGNLFEVFERQDLTTEEREALEFLYAYMPVADIMNKDGAYFLEQTRSSLQTKAEMEWGAQIPEMIFRHFVLPVRVNNEDLDNARPIFAKELKDRVKGMSMREAVLEINHWCHRHVVYTPSDQRTIAPLAAVKTAQGRCGEESTFTVTALRSVGIPARQIYTPRWAHTDSNHAWVEAWIDGKWYFFGACEPEPVLNLGWFNGPAYRALLLHTRVFGKYDGPEEVMMRTANFTEINVLPDYAPTARGMVTVIDGNGKPVKDAKVEFMIFNGMSFSSVLTAKTDKKGQCSLTAGKGDMFIWVTKDDKVGCGKLTFGNDLTLLVILDKKASELRGFDLDIIPPAPGSVPAEEEVTDDMRQANSRRMAADDSLRNAYTATFLSHDQALAEAAALGLEDTRVAPFLETSRGNWREILAFLQKTPAEKRSDAVALLSVISAKDLQDTPAETLFSHIDETINNKSPLYVNYILNPRISNELLTPYKKALRSLFTEEFVAKAQQNPELVVEWCKKELTLIDELNPQRIMSSPAGIARARVCDAGSRDIFFIALCRSLGIPARNEPVARRLQYFSDEWHNVDFTGEKETLLPTGFVQASFNNPTDKLPYPIYRQHFTIFRIEDDGALSPRNYRGGGRGGRFGGEQGSGFGGGQRQVQGAGLLQEPLEAETGAYMLLSGTRMADGSVLAHIEFYTIEEGKTTQTQLIVRDGAVNVQVIGNMNPEAQFLPASVTASSEDEKRSILSVTGRGWFVLGILGAQQEPTNHALNDIARTAKEFEDWNRSILLLFPDKQELSKFNINEFKGLPSTITYGIDINNIAAELVKELKLTDTKTLPIFVIADSFGRIVYVSQGYTIGIGESMLKVIEKLSKL